MTPSVFIHSIGIHLPEETCSNQELIQDYGEWTTNKIVSKTGIQCRKVCREGELVSDLAVNAANALFENNPAARDEIDFLILCTESPDYLLPPTSCIVHARLGLSKNCAAFDYNLGCSGYIYGLALAKSLVHSGLSHKTLLIMADTYTKHINAKDKSTRTIFGDGAAASLICRGPGESFIGEFSLGTDGSGAFELCIPAGGMKNPRTQATAVEMQDKYGNIRSQNNLYMNGPALYKFTDQLVPELVNQVMIKNDFNFDNIDLFIFHQANAYLLEKLRSKINIPKDKYYVNLLNIGNTVSASIPIAMSLAENEGKLTKGMHVCLIGFGVGFSWGGTIIKW